MKVSKKKVAENRDALVRAAGRLFRERGIDGVGIAEICQQAGLTHGALYAQFPSKEALAAEALADGVNRGHLRMTATAAPTWQSTHVAYYPLWRATSEGRPVETRRGALGDLEARAPRAEATIDLLYERGAAETAGVAISAAALVALALVWVSAGRRCG